MPKGINITAQKFADWLETLPQDMALGEFDRCRTCPIASYLHHLGVGQVLVGPWDFSVWPEDLSREPYVYALPAWAVDFISRYDDGTEDKVSKAVTIMEGMLNA